MGYLYSPSQSFIVNMPVDYRIAISGSAGTGKTVCAWYRLQNLAKQGHIIGFVAPNKRFCKYPSA
jgi:nucleoside-triphosphatase THEP1